MTTVATDLQFEPPGPGSWVLDPVHFPRPATRYWSEIHPEPFKRGFAEFTRYYGMLVGGLEMAYVNGFAYRTMAPVAEQEIPERLARAEQVFPQKVWREQLREWDEQCKPASIATHRELQSVDPDALSDDELVEYLTRCRKHHAEMIYQHMRFSGAALIAVGDFLVHAGQWTGVPPAELLSMMRGATPVSAGVSVQLAEMVAAIKADSAARSVLESGGDPAQVLDQLRTLDSDTGRAVAAYLDLTGFRLLDGFDIGGRYALELPDALVRAIRASVEAGIDTSTQDEVEATVAEVRAKVSEEHREEFDQLLDEARRMYRIRDERGVFSDIWASGIMRRAAVQSGRRLASSGRIHDPEHFVDAGFEEMCALVSGTNGPSADELAQRYEWRARHNAKEAPPTLGPPEPPPPDPSGLPPGAMRVM
jgi:rifampicin phosphotransferase